MMGDVRGSGPVIDTHQHLGLSMFTGIRTERVALIAAMDSHAVDVALVMPQPSRDDAVGLHDHIHRDVVASAGRLLGMASIDPWWDDVRYLNEARRCVRELGFVALKLHPLGHNIPPHHPEAQVVFRAAAELGVPVIVHTGLGTPWSLPSLCIPPAKAFAEVPVILAHAGWGHYSDEAIIAADVCPNIMLEPSWCPAYTVRKMVDHIGAERMLFGSDHITNLPVELAKLGAIEIDDAERQAILTDNPLRVFNLEPARDGNNGRS